MKYVQLVLILLITMLNSTALALEKPSLGNISLGSSLGYIESVYGKPKLINSIGTRSAYAYGNGDSVQFTIEEAKPQPGNPVFNGLLYIFTTKNNGFNTPEGIHVGSTLQEVFDKYSDIITDCKFENISKKDFNRLKKANSNQEQINLILKLVNKGLKLASIHAYDISKGSEYGIYIFHFKDNKVSKIILSVPSDDLFEIEGATSGNSKQAPPSVSQNTTFTPIGSTFLLENSFRDSVADKKLITSHNQIYGFKWTSSGNKPWLQIVDSHQQAVLDLVDPYNGSNYAYLITEYQANNPNFKLWLIEDTEGSGGYNYGFWIIGEYKGKIVKFLDRKNIFTMIGDNIVRNSMKITPTNNGFQLTLANKKFVGEPYQKYAYDHIAYVKIFWDDKANWFGMSYGK